MPSDLAATARTKHLAPYARIHTAEDLAALASDLAESVMFMAERDPDRPDADEQELIRILIVADKLRKIAKRLRSNTL